MPEKSFSECSVCHKSFSTPSNLRRHIINQHSAEKPDLLNTLRYKNSEKYKFTCECGKNFNHLHHFNSHKQIHESCIKGKQAKKKCPVCDYSVLNKVKMLNHFKDSHSINIQSKELEFSSLEQFMNWKSDLEIKTFYKYIQKSKTSLDTHSNNFETVYFCCHRSGTYTPKGRGIRQLKFKGSNKINGYCPASIKLIKFNNGRCKVVFIETHVGHKAELKFLHLTISEKKDLANKIAAGIPYEKIIDEVKQSADPAETRRIDLLTKKDLHNIQISLIQPTVAVEKVIKHHNEIPKSPINKNILKESETDIKKISLAKEICSEHRQDSKMLEDKKELIMAEFSNYLKTINSNEKLDNLRAAVNSCKNKSSEF